MAVFITISNTVFAMECTDSKGEDILNQPEVFQQLIENSGTCYEAAGLARACAWGSSLDVSTAGLAAMVCQNELSSLSPEEPTAHLLDAMTQACNSKYATAEGTLAMSMAAFCRLDALAWIVDLATSY